MPTNEFSYLCPECGEIVFVPNFKALLLIKGAGADLTGKLTVSRM